MFCEDPNIGVIEDGLLTARSPGSCEIFSDKPQSAPEEFNDLLLTAIPCLIVS